MQLKQLIPQKFCLACDVCCRFTDQHTIWAPVFTKKEIRGLRGQKLLSPNAFSNNKPDWRACRISLEPYRDFFICPCYKPKNHKCQIYTKRPLDCRLYPFVLLLRQGNYFLGQDRRCPYLLQCRTQELNEYRSYLKEELSSRQMLTFLSNNRELFVSYPEEDVETLFLLPLDQCASIDCG